MKGGTDVIVAILGVELGLLSPDLYTTYTIVAIATVVVSPALIARFAAKATPSPSEAARLECERGGAARVHPSRREGARPHAGCGPSFVVHANRRALAASKQVLGETFDVTDLRIAPNAPDRASQDPTAATVLGEVDRLDNVELSRRDVDATGPVRAILDASRGHDLIVIGARPPRRAAHLSLGRLQDAIVHHANTSVLVVVSDNDALLTTPPQRLIVPLIGLEYSFAAADVAAHLALGWDAILSFSWRSPIGQGLSAGTNAIVIA